jgi:hypothetical protein
VPPNTDRGRCDRRSVLGVLLGGLTVCLLGKRSVLATEGGTAASQPTRADLDRRALEIGAWLATHGAIEARRLLGLKPSCSNQDHGEPSMQDPAKPCRCFLEPARLANEFARGEVVSVDGWQLARSEAAFCVCIYVLAGGEL